MSENFRKISWIKWDTIYSIKEQGCLGVRRLRKFNLALLGKWCWGMLGRMGVYGIRCYVPGTGRLGGVCVLEGEGDRCGGKL